MNKKPDTTDNPDARRCPQCGEALVHVGAFWVCPTHGQVPEPRPFTALRIFLSYGHDANEELVHCIKADLEQRGHDVWFDKMEIKAGDDWRRAITDGILHSQRVVSFLSKHSTRDPGVCRDEIAIAIGVKGGNIQTVLVESETEVQPPVNIGHIQWLDMHDWRQQREVGAATWEEWYQTKLAEIIRVVESDESRRFAGEIEILHGHLKPIRSDARIYDLLGKGFFGRTWLFEAVEKWRQEAKRDSRLFWITGDPGVGKSAFAAQLTHTRSDAVIAAQFVEWDKPDHRDARRVVRSLAFQLATRLPDYRKLVLALPEIAELDRKDPAELFDYLLANPLRSVIGGGRERQIIVVDALDEAGEAGRNPLVEMLARNVPRLPDWLGLVVTSRPESAVQTPLQGLNPFVLDTGTEANRADLRDYLQQKLAPQLHDRPDADRLIGQILEKSEGVFLYVERFCDDVQHGHISLDRPEQFPQGLGGTFFQWFQRQFPDLEEFRRAVRPALRAVLAAREPLPVELLQRLFHWQDEELRDFTRTLGSLFPVNKETNSDVIKPYHKALADWLADEVKAGAHYVSVKAGHRLLADYGRDCWPEDDYALAHYPSHLASCQDWTALSELLITSRFIRLKRIKFGYASLAKDYEIFSENNVPRGLSESGLDLFQRVSSAVKALARFSGRTAETAQTEELLRRDHPKHVVVTGAPAIGKTWFLTHMWLGDIDHRVLIRLPMRSYGSFSEIERHICSDVSRYLHVPFPPKAESIYAIPHPLPLLNDLLTKGTCLIVDEMDAVLSSYEKESHDLPSTKCRFLWGTRPRTDFVEFLKEDFSVICLAPLSDFEIASYIQTQLVTKLKGRSDADMIIEKIRKRSEGNPYLLSVYCDAIRDDKMDDDSVATPMNLMGYYRGRFQERFPDLVSFDTRVRPALSAILAVSEPLSIRTLQKLLHWHEEEVSEFTLALNGLFIVTVNDGTQVISPFHDSLRVWLTDVNPATLVPLAGPYCVDVEVGKRMLSSLDALS